MNDISRTRCLPNFPPARRVTATLAVLLSVQLFWSCGGGSVDGGISGTGVIFGPITGFGSVIVNQIEFDVDDAAIVVNGSAAGEGDLRLGMLVTIRGERNTTTRTGVAESVDYDSVLRGPIEAVDLGNGTVQVLAQLSRTDPKTVFDGITLDTAMPGDVVEISGLVDSDGILLATRVDFKPTSTIFDVEGTISLLDPIARTFSIGMLQIDYSSADIEDEPDGGLTNGLFVEVEAFSAPTGGVLVAVEVEVSDDSFGGEEGEDAEIRGFVTEIVSSTRFVLNGNQNVTTSPSTIYIKGSVADLVVNADIEVEGTFDMVGTLSATQIEFE